MVSAFRTVITPLHVERAVTALLQHWSATYVAEIAGQLGYARDHLHPFQSYVPSLTTLLDTLPDPRRLPAAIVVCPGTAEVSRERHGIYSATWELGVGVVATGQDQEDTFANTAMLLGAVRSIVLQNTSLGVDWVEATYWEGERMDELPGEDSRTLAAGEASFIVVTPAAIDPRGGTPSPLPDPIAEPPEWGTVQSVDVALRQGGPPWAG